MARILLVDDDDQVRRMQRMMLERAGHEVIEASDGDECLKLYRSHPTDLIITDILMPNKEGLETIREIRREFGDVRIIAVSGGGALGPSNYLKLAKNFGALETLAKPFGRDELLAAVSRVMKQGAASSERIPGPAETSPDPSRPGPE